MSIRTLWRSTVFVITILLIYLAFPIIIVPSSLPAIQKMFIEQEYPKEFFGKRAVNPTNDVGKTNDVQILELNIPTIPTTKDKLILIKTLHKQGMERILP